MSMRAFMVRLCSTEVNRCVCTKYIRRYVCVYYIKGV